MKSLLVLSMCLFAALTSLTGCSAKVESSGTPLTPAPEDRSGEKTVACAMDELVNGKIDGKEWATKSGVVRSSEENDMWEVTLFDVAGSDPCSQFGSEKGINFRFPKTIGTYDIEGERTVVFYDLTQDPQMNYLTTNGKIVLTTSTPSEVEGTLEAYLDEQTGACGKFKLSVCD